MKSPVHGENFRDQEDYKEIQKIINNIEIELEEFSKNKKLKIGILGEVKAGKSTLVNALLKKKISPVGITETTGSIIRINHNPKQKSKITYLNGDYAIQTTNTIIKKIHDYDNDFNQWKDCASIHLNIDNPTIKTFELIDTPGLQTLNKEAEIITEDIFKSIDLIIWVFNYAHIDQNDIKEKLELFIEKFPKPVVAVINKAENVSDKKTLIEDFNNKFLFFDNIKKVIPLSAKDAFEGFQSNDKALIKSSGIDNLLNHLKKVQEKGASLVKYESNKEVIQSLLKQFIAIQKEIKRELLEKRKMIKNRLKKERIQRDRLQNLLESKKNEVKILDPLDTFEEQIVELNYYIDTIKFVEIHNKEELKNKIQKKLAQCFSEETINQKLNDYLETISEDLHELLEKDKKFKKGTFDNEMILTTQDNLADNISTGVSLSGIASIGPAFFQAVLGSNAVSVTFFGALPQFIMPGILIGSTLAYFLKDDTYSHLELKESLKQIYEQINNKYIETIEELLDHLEDKLNVLYQKKKKAILKENGLKDLKVIDIKIEQLESYIETFDEQTIVNKLLPQTPNTQSTVVSSDMIKQQLKGLNQIEEELKISKELLDESTTKTIEDIQLLKMDLQQKIIEFKKNDDNYISITNESWGNLIIAKTSPTTDVLFKSNQLSEAFQKNLKILNRMNDEEFYYIVKGDLILNETLDDYSKGVQMFLNYLTIALDSVGYLYLGDNRHQQIIESQLDEVLEYLNQANTRGSSIRQKDVNYIIKIASLMRDNKKISKQQAVQVRDNLLKETFLMSDEPLDHNEVKNTSGMESSKVEIKEKKLKLREMLKLLEENPAITKKKKIDIIIHVTALTCSLVAIQPIPFADILILSPIQATMATSLNKIIENDMKEKDATDLVKALATTAGWGVLSQQAVLGLYKTILPFMGAVTTMPLVYASTYALGRLLVRYYDRDGSLSKQEIKKIYKEELKISKEMAKNLSKDKILERLRTFKAMMNSFRQQKGELEEKFHKLQQNKDSQKVIKEVKKTLKKRLDNNYPNLVFSENYINNMIFINTEEQLAFEREMGYAELNVNEVKEVPTPDKIGSNIVTIKYDNNKYLIDIVSANQHNEITTIIQENRELKNQTKELKKNIDYLENEIHNLTDEREQVDSRIQSLKQKIKEEKNKKDISSEGHQEMIALKSKRIRALQKKLEVAEQEKLTIEEELSNKDKALKQEKEKKDTHQLFIKFYNSLKEDDEIIIDASIKALLNKNVSNYLDEIRNELIAIREQFDKNSNNNFFEIHEINSLGELLVININSQIIYDFKPELLQVYKTNENMINQLSPLGFKEYYLAEKQFLSNTNNYGNDLLSYFKLLEAELEKYDYFMSTTNFNMRQNTTLGSYVKFFEYANRNFRNEGINQLLNINKKLDYVRRVRNKIVHASKSIITIDEYNNVRNNVIKELLPVILKVDLP